MHINSIRLLPYRLLLRQAWRTSREVFNERSGWIIELTTDDGRIGIGDCAPLPAAGTEAAVAAHAWLEKRISTMRKQTPQAAVEALPTTVDTPAARHALETALLDLICQTQGLSLRQWLNPQALDLIPLNGSAGSLDEDTLNRCANLEKQGYRICKLKVGLTEVDQELRWLQQLCEQLPDDIRLRLDANGAWNLNEAQRFLSGIGELAIESVEEPLAEPRPEQLAGLQGMTPIALALDESLPRFHLDHLLEHPPVRRLILKPPVLGGLLPSLELARRAEQAELETLVTSTLESSVGIQAAAQLAAAVHRREQPLAHGLATSEWFTSDVADRLKINSGHMLLPDATGLGIRLKSTFGQDRTD